MGRRKGCILFEWCAFPPLPVFIICLQVCFPRGNGSRSDRPPRGHGSFASGQRVGRKQLPLRTACATNMFLLRARTRQEKTVMGNKSSRDCPTPSVAATRCHLHAKWKSHQRPAAPYLQRLRFLFPLVNINKGTNGRFILLLLFLSSSFHFSACCRPARLRYAFRLGGNRGG